MFCCTYSCCLFAALGEGKIYNHVQYSIHIQLEKINKYVCINNNVPLCTISAQTTKHNLRSVGLSVNCKTVTTAYSLCQPCFV